MSGNIENIPATTRWRKPSLLVQTGRTIIALMLREMATTYGRSPGGYLWAVLEPIAGIALLSFIFSNIFNHPALGNNFPLFYATGVLPLLMYNSIAAKVALSLRYSRPFLAYPTVTFLDAMVARLLLNAAVELLVFSLVISGIALIFQIPLVVNLPTVLQGLGLAILLGAGVGALNCFLFTRFPVWERSWQIFNRPLFMISGTFFLYENIPATMRDWLWYNPLVHVISLVRRGIYGTYRADFVSEGYVIAFIMVTMVTGLFLLLRHYRNLLEL